MWQLQKEENGIRLYRNSITNSESTTKMVYTDKSGNSWWMFENLLMIPFTRNYAAMKITGLYKQGMTKEDLDGHISSMKSILKSDDAEKYEKAYAELLQFESHVQNGSDALRQMSSLVCVYFMMDDEPIDAFINDTQLRKMSLIESDPDMHAFFLNLQTEAIMRYSTTLETISQIASPKLSW